MRTGRPRIILDQAVKDLQEALIAGPQPAELLFKAIRAGKHTLRKAKVIVEARSKKVNGKWYWYIPSEEEKAIKSQTISELMLILKYNQSKANQPSTDLDYYTEADIEPKNITPFYTKDILNAVKYWHLNQDKPEQEVAEMMIEESKTRPTDPCYSEDYIRALVSHIVNQTPKPALPAGITEK